MLCKSSDKARIGLGDAMESEREGPGDEIVATRTGTGDVLGEQGAMLGSDGWLDSSLLTAALLTTALQGEATSAAGGSLLITGIALAEDGVSGDLLPAAIGLVTAVCSFSSVDSVIVCDEWLVDANVAAAGKMRKRDEGKVNYEKPTDHTRCCPDVVAFVSAYSHQTQVLPSDTVRS